MFLIGTLTRTAIFALLLFVMRAPPPHRRRMRLSRLPRSGLPC